MGIENFKRQFIASFIIIFLFMFLNDSGQATEKSNFMQRFSIKMTSGLSYLTVGDINTFLQSVNEEHTDIAQYYNGLKKGELKKIRFGSGSEVELTFDITPRFRIGLGTGYIYDKRESSSGFEIEAEVIPPDLYYVDVTFSPRVSISAIPIKFGAYYIFPLGSNKRLFINGGIDYYFTKTRFYWKQIEVLTRTRDGFKALDGREWAEWDLISKGIGFHGGIGFEYDFAKNFALIIETQGTFAKLNKLKGDEIYVGYRYSEQNYYGYVFYFERGSIIGKFYPELGFFKEKPDYPYPDYRNIRDALLDLSGYFLRIGIKIRLF
jgi:hypothetical protein